MKDNAILVNCAGGGMVDEKTLLRALDKKKMGSAALDVIEIEPPTLDVYGEFLKHENVIMTPHIGDIPKENQNRTGSGGWDLMDVLEGREASGKSVQTHSLPRAISYDELLRASMNPFVV